jgi:histone deacetylase 1/2
MGVGIMSSGPTATHGAGPSSHTTAARILSSSAAVGPSQMDVDSPSTDNGADGASGSRAGISNAGTDDMTMDALAGSET